MGVALYLPRVRSSDLLGGGLSKLSAAIRFNEAAHCGRLPTTHPAFAEGYGTERASPSKAFGLSLLVRLNGFGLCQRTQYLPPIARGVGTLSAMSISG